VQILQIRKIKLPVIEARDIVFRSEFAHERCAKSPARAKNYNFHLVRALVSDRSFSKPKP